MVNKGRTGDPVDDFSRRELHVEGYGVSVAGIVVDKRQLLYYGLDLKSCGDLCGELIEVVRQDSCLDDLKVNVDSFIKIGDDEKVVK